MSDSLSNHDLEGIAVIGMSGRFPGAGNVEEFWENLRAGVESITCFTDEELLASGVSASRLRDPAYVRAKGILRDIEHFDAAFFGMSPREATIMDPQHRLFLECAWEALESAGYDPYAYTGSIGLFAGAGTNSYLLLNVTANPECWSIDGDHQIRISNEKDHLATRVSYKLNMRGPSLTVQTSCSTALVAVHLACQSLLNYECDMALAGGVSLSIPQRTGYTYHEGGIASPDGHCRAFDAGAKGTVGGSGAGIVVLKRMADALADGDSVSAVIKGSAINNDGSGKVGYTAPSVRGQAEAIVAAAGIAGVSLDSIGYVEAHGTGTPLGDPIEIEALTRAFRTQTNRKGFCAIGAVKTNIGHLNTAAGVAGLIKTVLALKHRQLPPSLHFRQPNPQINFANSPFYVNTTLSPWEEQGGARTAGVSSFGLGGTNAHVVVTEAPAPPASTPGRPWLVFPLSARTEGALEMASDRLVAHLCEHPDLPPADVAYTLQIGRHAFATRRVLIGRNLAEAVASVQSPTPNSTQTAIDVPEHRAVLFLLPGQGTRLLNEGREVYLHEPVFRETVDHCAALLKTHLGLELRDLIYPEPDCRDWAQEQLKQTALVQPVLFVLEYALAQLWRAWGVHPQALLGHSLGEYTAACLSGVFSLESALWLVTERGRLQQQTPPGAMTAVTLSEQEVQDWLAEDVWLAAVNGAHHCTLSGSPDAIERVESALRDRSIGCTRLHTSQAFHSGLMDAIVPRFLECMRHVTLNPPQIPYLSNVTGAWIQSHEATDVAYWGRHLRQPVRFSQGLEQATTDLKHAALLEVGPGTVLSKLARATAHTRGGVVIGSLPGKTAKSPESDDAIQNEANSAEEIYPELKRLMEAAGALWLAGVDLDWGKFSEGQQRLRIPLPTYPFQRQRCWLDLPHKSRSAVASTSFTRAGRYQDVSSCFYVPTWNRLLLLPAYVADHGESNTGSWVVFADAFGPGAQLVSRLQQAGQPVVAVTSGDEYWWTGESSVTIDRCAPHDYVRLIEEITARFGGPQRILHLWSVTESFSQVLNRPEDHYRRFARSQEQGYYSLLYLAQALAHLNRDRVSLLVVGNGLCDVSGVEDLYPDKATLLGLCTVLAQENADILCRCVDIMCPQEIHQTDWLIDQLLAEAVCTSADPLVAYRGKNRLLQEYQPVPLEGQNVPIRALRTEGVYLITGGLGKIGLALAEHLARSVRARLILLGRSGFPSREQWNSWLASHEDSDPVSAKIRTLLAFEEAGSIVSVVVADVADVQHMSHVVEEIYARFGALHGVFHVAGITRRDPTAFAPLVEMAEPLAEVHFRPKVYGLYALEQALQGRHVDFCALFGSNAAVLGGFGYGAYAAANCFMNAFAADRTKHSPIPWLSINWDGWSMGATQRHAHPSERNPAERHQDSPKITESEGMAALERIVSHYPSGPIVVSTTDLAARVRSWLYHEAPATSPSLSTERTSQAEADEVSRTDLPTTYIAPRNAVEQTIVEIWQRLLGVAPIGVEDNFFDLNGHSLLAVRLMGEIKKAFGRQLPLQILFKSATVAALARALDAASEATTGASEATDGGSKATDGGSEATTRNMMALTPVREGSSRVPLFCVATPMANALGYVALARRLGDDQPLYVLQSQYHHTGAKPLSRDELRDLAATYIETIRAQFPTGPYCLSGMCEGVYIAFEMAHQFHEAGEQVPLLISYDTWPEENTRTRFGWWLTAIDRALTKFKKNRSVGLQTTARRLAAVTVRAVREWVLLPFRPPAPDSWEARYWPGRSFTPDRFEGRITVLRVQEQDLYRIHSRDLGWSARATEGTDVYDMPGGHTTLLREPHVREVAAVVQQHLDRVQPIGRSFAAVSTDREMCVASHELSVVSHEKEMSCEQSRSRG